MEFDNYKMITEIIVPSLYFVTGICAYAGFVHLSAGLRRPFDPIQLLFGLMCLAVSIHTLFHSQTVRAKDLGDFIVALKWSLNFTIMFFVIFLWFIALFSKKYPLVRLSGISLVFGSLLVVNMAQPYSLQYASISTLKTLTLPWGETITLANGQAGGWFYLGIIMALVSFSYVLYALVCFYRRSSNQYSLLMLAAIIFFMICSIEGILVRLSVINFVHLGPYGFLGMTIAMSLFLHHEYHQRLSENEEKLRGLYELSPLGIALTDMKGRFIEFNESFLRICGYSADELKNLDYWALTPKEYESQEAAQLDSLMRVGYYGPFEKEYSNKDGERIPLRLNGMLVRGTDGQNYIWSIVEDISKWKQTLKALSDSEERYRLIVENSSEGIWSIDKTFRTVFVNSAMARMLGYTPEQMLGRLMENFVVEKDIPNYRREMQLRSQGEDSHYELRFRRNDGRLCWCSITGTSLKDNHGSFAGAFAMYTDITNHKLAEEEMQLAALVYQASSQAMMVTDADNRIITVNPAFAEVTGYESREVLGKNPDFLRSNCHDSTFYQNKQDSINSTGKWQGEVWNRRKNGEVYLARLIINTIYRDDGTTHRRVSLFSDITEEKKNEELIWRQANYDFLTGLPNRRMVYDRLKDEIKRSRRDRTQLAVLFIDLDRFKEVNDSLGHDVGDTLLQEAAARMVNSMRESDIVGRLGGDEFIIILIGLDDISGVGRITNSLLDKLAMPYKLGDELAYISASIGITIYPEDSTDITTLLKNADQAMYAAKRQGRNRFHYYTPAMQEAANSRMRIANDLHGALADNQFTVHYQPIVELMTGTILKAEALIRWQHPKLGLISPADFIPIAEDTGQIIEIGDWVIRQAVAQVVRLRTLHQPEFQISVNMSPVQFMANPDNQIPRFDYLTEAGLPGQSIVVEITEGLLMEAREEISSQLLAFRDNGIQVALDDFGTGYSSLSYLKKFDIDYLKIDQSFVRNLAPGSSDMVLCEAMIGMAHKLGIKVIAEGVETPDQCSLLRQIGCDYGQGYLFSKAVPAKEFETMLSAYKKLHVA